MMEKPQLMYIGSYTSAILLASLGTDNTVTILQSIPTPIANPTWLTLSNSKRHLYAVGEVNDFEGQYSGAVSCFAIDERTHELSLVNTVSSCGGSPCHLAIDDTDSYIFVSNYMSGTATIIEVNADGSLGGAKVVLSYTSTSVDKPAHVHHTLLLDNAAFICDLGSDAVYHYSAWRDGTGRVQSDLQVRQITIAHPPASGPRHLILHPSLPYLYCLCELNSTLTVLHKDSLDILFTYSTLRPQESSEGMSGAELHLSCSGRFLYCSNRDISKPNQQRSSIAVFSISSTGELQLTQHVATGGMHPRYFMLFANDSRLMVANMSSNNIAIFCVDVESGCIDDNACVVTVDDSLIYPSHMIFVP